jgi:plastocyanin
MARTRRWTILAAPLAILLALAALSGTTGAPRALAQGDDPPHPAHIHSGTCADLGDIVAPLSDVALQTAGESFGAASAIPVKESETDVAISLSDILGAPHAVNIHESAEAIQVYIACGDIGGRVVDGELVIGLHEIDGSGHSGVAVLETDDDGTDVTVYLAEEAAEEEAAEAAPPADAAETPAAETPAADAAPPATAAAEAPAAETAAPAAAQDVPVDMRDIAYSPDAVQIAVGDSVTWTNQDPVPHTATGQDRAVLQSGTVAPGASFTQTFDQAGEFAYFCEFHPNMAGTIVVQ